MKKPQVAALTGLLLLGACSGYSQSNWNPVNWFGGSNEVTVAEATLDVGTASDPRPLVDQVLTMTVERYPGGAIVRATGLPPTQGYWAGDLIEESFEDGRLTFRFVVLPPVEPKRVSTQASREIEVGTSVPQIKLDSVREIIVVGAQNARSSRR